VKCLTNRDIDADVNCFPKYVSETAVGKKVIKAGTIICRDEFSLADCVSLVLNGLATPADEECRNACNRSEAQIMAAKAAMDRLLSGKGMAEDKEEEDENENEEDDE
jgi:hypothetical protein